jgi:hypothetical protein
VTAVAEPVERGQYVLIAVADTGFGMSPCGARARLRAVLSPRGLERGSAPGTVPPTRPD